MSTITAPPDAAEDWTLVDQIAADPAPAPHLHVLAIRHAIVQAAIEGGGYVSAASIRPHLPVWVEEHRPGIVTSALVRAGALVDTGRTTRSGNRRSRNANRHVPVYFVPDIEAVR